MAAAYMRIGGTCSGRPARARRRSPSTEKCHEIVQALADRDPDGPVARANLAVTLTMLGEMTQELRRDVPASLAYYQQSLALRQAMAALPPDDKLDPAKLPAEPGRVVHPGRGHVPAAGRAGPGGRATSRTPSGHPGGAGRPATRPTCPSSSTSPGPTWPWAKSGSGLRDWPAAKVPLRPGPGRHASGSSGRPGVPDRYRLELANALGNVGVFALRTGTSAEAGTAPAPRAAADGRAGRVG